MRKNVSFSQIFLADAGYKSKIVSAIDCQGKVVFEIGSGKGDLTGLIAEKAEFIYGLEIDRRLVALAEKNLCQFPNVKLLLGDFRAQPLPGANQDLIIFSSVPYHLSSAFIYCLISWHRRVSKAYLVLQKEFAEKITAKPGDKLYGSIGCIISYYAQIKLLFDIPAGAFRPRPRVDSVFLLMNFRQKKSLVETKNEEQMIEIIKLCFQQRRKKMISILRQRFSLQKLSLLNLEGINLNLRPEETSLEDFCRISDFLHNKKI